MFFKTRDTPHTKVLDKPCHRNTVQHQLQYYYHLKCWKQNWCEDCQNYMKKDIKLKSKTIICCQRKLVESHWLKEDRPGLVGAISWCEIGCCYPYFFRTWKNQQECPSVNWCVSVVVFPTKLKDKTYCLSGASHYSRDWCFMLKNLLHNYKQSFLPRPFL
jgi:hypothetical protein